MADKISALLLYAVVSAAMASSWLIIFVYGRGPEEPPACQPGIRRGRPGEGGLKSRGRLGTAATGLAALGPVRLVGGRDAGPAPFLIVPDRGLPAVRASRAERAMQVRAVHQRGGRHWACHLRFPAP